MVSTLPSKPYITKLIPDGPNHEGVMTFRMTGMFAEVFDNLQVQCCSIENQPMPVYVVKYFSRHPDGS